MIGPVFFILLETSIRRGIRAALAFDAGVLISDIFYILIAYLFYSEVAGLTKGENKDILQMVGGVFLVVYGVITFFKKTKAQHQDEMGNSINSSREYLMLFIKGFFLNIANPMVIFYWFSVMAIGAKDTEHVTMNTSMLIYILVLLTTFFSIDLLKIVGAKSLRRFVTDKVLRSLNQITGSILFIFGVVLFVRGFFGDM